AGPIPNRSDFLVTARGEIDFAAAARVLAAIVSESKDAQLAELTGPIASQVFWTRDFFRDVLPAFGPSFAAAAWPGAATVPNAVVGVAFREPTIAGVIPVSQVIEHSLRFLGVAAALDSYKPNHERWALELRQAGPARIHYLSGPPAKKGLAPGFAVHRGWLLAGTNPEALAESLAALDGPVKNEPSGLHVDLVQVRRLVERLPPASADDHKREVALMLLGVFDDFRATSKSADGRREHRLEWTVRQAARP
ncbi:MAG TPA: hypothetical protein VNC50_04625, partial [Planctomycetia bacterium]|nr:hypothetical protein [Planctomycetia bacterium]